MIAVSQIAYFPHFTLNVMHLNAVLLFCGTLFMACAVFMHLPEVPTFFATTVFYYFLKIKQQTHSKDSIDSIMLMRSCHFYYVNNVAFDDCVRLF